mmetsp:Transcript_36426/g.77657  ORF Transcript_36426/g.77657 Transcript_36426/m.77657 type:complete len:239 (+) Transcript_36426:3376-4092(+)
MQPLQHRRTANAIHRSEVRIIHADFLEGQCLVNTIKTQVDIVVAEINFLERWEQVDVSCHARGQPKASKVELHDPLVPALCQTSDTLVIAHESFRPPIALRPAWPARLVVELVQNFLLQVFYLDGGGRRVLVKLPVARYLPNIPPRGAGLAVSTGVGPGAAEVVVSLHRAEDGITTIPALVDVMPNILVEPVAAVAECGVHHGQLVLNSVETHVNEPLEGLGNGTRELIVPDVDFHWS